MSPFTKGGVGRDEHIAFSSNDGSKRGPSSSSFSGSGLGSGRRVPPSSKGGPGGIFKVDRTRRIPRFGAAFSSGLLPHWAALIVLLVAFIPVSIFNCPLFWFINAAHHPLSDSVWLGLTTLGDGLMLSVVAGAFLVVNPRITILGLTAMVLCSVTVNFIKFLVPTVRPAEALESVHVIGPLLRSGSFPSGHAGSSMVLGLAIAYLSSSRVLKGAAIGGAVLVSMSRIFVGAHFPRDIVGGMIIALTLFIAFVGLVWRKIESRIPETPDFSLSWIRLLLAAEILATVYSLGAHAPFYAESGPVGAAIAVAVLFFIAAGMRSQTRKRMSKE
jgi:membrane-associated phospholipid phosphatase